jgi:alpha-tubulin suppressor-like RCC1 family protein
LGTGNNKSINYPQEFPFLNHKELICGESFNFAICGTNVFSWGKNDVGQLGLGDTNNRNIPTKVDFFDGKNIIQISCGYLHCIALEGEFYFCKLLRQWKSLFLGKQ